MAIKLFGMNPPPARANADRPAYEVSVPATVRAMTFEVRGDATTIDLDLSSWEGEQDVVIASPTGEIVRVLRVGGWLSTGQEVDWTANTSEEGSSAVIDFKDDLELKELSITLRNGRVTASGQYRFLRTTRIDVVGREIEPATAEGIVTVDTGGFAVERFVTDASSRSGTSQGATAQYQLSGPRVVGANADALPVPAVSIDLLDVEAARARDPLLVGLGAVLGIAGGVLIEILLIAAYLLAPLAGRRERSQ